MNEFINKSHFRLKVPKKLMKYFINTWTALNFAYFSFYFENKLLNVELVYY